MTRNEGWEVSLGGIAQLPLERQGLDILLGHYPDAVLLKVDTQRERDLFAGPRRYRQSDGSWLCVDLLVPIPDDSDQRAALDDAAEEIVRLDPSLHWDRNRGLIYEKAQRLLEQSPQTPVCRRFAIWKQTGDVYRVLNEFFEVEEDPFLWPEGGPFRSERKPEWTQTHSE